MPVGHLYVQEKMSIQVFCPCLKNICLSASAVFLSLFLPPCLSLQLHWVLAAVCRLPLAAVSGAVLQSRSSGFALWWLFLLQSTGSRACGLSRGTRAQVPHSMRNLPRPGIKPMSPASAGGFFFFFLFFPLSFLIFKLLKYDNTFTGDLKNTEQSYMYFHNILQLFFKHIN